MTTTQTPWTHLPAEGCGWLADAMAESLATRLTDALSASSEECRAMGKAGRRLVEQRHSLVSVIGQLDRVYA